MQLNLGVTKMKIGIDAGGTLIKIVQESEQGRQYTTRKTTDIQQVIAWLQTQSHCDVHLTGGNAKTIQEQLSYPTQMNVEFDAAAKGLEILLKEQGHHLSRYIFTNVGTGTSIHFSDGEQQTRVGGIGTGGGMIQGLGYLLTQISDYEQLMATAQTGDREFIDLKVRHIYKNATPPIPGDLTAANFGKVLHNLDKDLSDGDKLASVIGVVGEAITTMSITVAREHDTTHVAYIGSSFNENPLLRKVVEDYTKLRGCTPYYIENGAHSGALGAIYLSAS